MALSRNLIFRAAAEAMGLLSGAVGVIYISRIVGPEYLGLSAATTAILALISRLADGGVTSLATQRLARDDDSIGSLLAITLPPKAALSVILISLVLLITNLLHIDPRLQFFITIAVFTVFLDTCSPAWIFIALGKINTASVIRIGQSLGSLAALLLFIQQPDDWRNLPYLMLFNSAVTFVMATYFLLHYKLFSFDTTVPFTHYLQKLKAFYWESLHFLKANLSTYAYMSSDRLILYYFTNPYTVGIYEAAYKIVQPFYAISDVVTPTMFRDLAQTFKNGVNHAIIARYTAFMSAATIPLGFFLLLFAQPVISILYGRQFAESVSCLQILGFVITFGFTSGVLVLPLSAWNMSREFGNAVFMGNAVNVLLNIILIPFWGALGAAIAVLAAKIIVTVVGFFYFKKATDYPVLRDFSFFFAASLAPFLVILFLSIAVTNNAILMIVYCVLYIGILTTKFSRWSDKGRRAIEK